MKATLKIPYMEFVGMAMERLRGKYNGIPAEALPVFMRKYPHDDIIMHDPPDYVEIEINL